MCTRTHALSLMSDSFAAPLKTVACQLPLPTELCSQEYWRGCHFLLQGSTCNPGIKPTSLASPALSGRFLTASATLGSPIHLARNKIFLEMNGHSNYHSGKIIYSSNIALNKGRGTGKLLFSKHFFLKKLYGGKDNIEEYSPLR